VGVSLFMNPRLVLVVVSLVLSLAIGLVVARSGAGGGEAKRGRPLIGLSMDTLKEERWQVDRDLFLERAKALGVDVLVQSANSDDSVQLTQVQSLITQGVDALVIIPHNGEAMAKAVALAHSAGVPVLSYDRLITGCDLDLYITFDNVKVGELQARFLAERIPEGGRLRVVRIYGSKTDNNAVLFKQGQDNVLKPLIEAGKVEVVFEDWAADWKPENAKKIMNAAITKSGPGIDAVLASNDGTAGGAVQALTEEGLAGKVLVTGQDGDLAACQRIVQGTQTMTVYKPIKVLASRAAEAAVRLAKGQSVIARSGIDNGKVEVPSLLLEITAVTRDNLRETIVADGFRAEADVYGK
jgi:D-xylose transport system substrate-binding protein